MGLKGGMESGERKRERETNNTQSLMKNRAEKRRNVQQTRQLVSCENSRD
jgi:hypothetical protein